MMSGALSSVGCHLPEGMRPGQRMMKGMPMLSSYQMSLIMQRWEPRSSPWSAVRTTMVSSARPCAARPASRRPKFSSSQLTAPK